MSSVMHDLYYGNSYVNRTSKWESINLFIFRIQIKQTSKISKLVHNLEAIGFVKLLVLGPF